MFLGDSYTQIPVLKEAKQRGYYIVTCDYLPENPGHKLGDEYCNVSTTDYESVLKIAVKLKPDYIIIKIMFRTLLLLVLYMSRKNLVYVVIIINLLASFLKSIYFENF